MTQPVPAIYQALAAIAAELAKEGIAKDRSNVEQRFKFRGVDDVMNALGPLLAKNGVIVLPEVHANECIHSVRQTKSGTNMYVTNVRVTYSFVAAADGSFHRCSMVGEGMDMGDKATAKALSASYKYAMLQTFSVPVEAMPDADAEGLPAEDWVKQSKTIAGWIAEAETVDQLVNLHGSPRVQEYFRDAPASDVDRVKKAFSARKATLVRRPAEAEAEQT